MPGAAADDAGWDRIRGRFADRGLQRVLVTLGADGSVVLDSQAAGPTDTRSAPTAVQAVDPTGAGDALTGAVAARLAARDPLAAAAAFASVALVEHRYDEALSSAVQLLVNLVGIVLAAALTLLVALRLRRREGHSRALFRR